MEINFFFRLSKGNRKANAGIGSISYYLTQFNTKPVEKTTGITCNRNEWNEVEKCFVGAGAMSKNNRLEKIKFSFENILNNANATQENLHEFVESVTTPLLKLKTFVDVMDEYLEFQHQKIRGIDSPRTETSIEESTYNTYLKRKENIILFLTKENKLRMNVSRFDGILCEKFDVWCVNTVGRTGKPRGQAYSTKHLKLIRSVVEFAVRNRYLTVNATKEYKFKQETEQKAFAAIKVLRTNDFSELKTINTISNETITTLQNFIGFTNTEQKYVDAFLFMRECWLHIGDYVELSDKHFKIDENKNCWIVKPRVKRLTDSGGQIQIMPLSPTAIEILNKYDTKFDGALSKLPKSKPSAFRQYLKMACARAGIKEHITLKYARSNGISNVYNNHKLRGEMIAVGAGWTTTEPLKFYLNYDFQNMRNEMLNLA